MQNTNFKIIEWLLSERRSIEVNSPHTPNISPEFASFHQAWNKESKSWQTPVDRAIVGGFVADCIAFAFSAGYCSALQYLVPSLGENAIACFCITEEGGGHPRAIKSQLVPLANDINQGKTFTLNGKKKYASCAKEADRLLVAASNGIRDDGTNSIRMISIDSKAPGIRIVPIENLNLVPEISHSELIFTDVHIVETDLLVGDGYTDYIKPFRTIEDLHVSAGILGYLFRNVCRYGWGTDIKERILGSILSVRNLAVSSTNAPAVHILTGDALKQIKELFKLLEPLWEKVGGKAKQDWDRDKRLMSIADKARTRRLQTAWEFYKEKSP